MLHAVVVLWFGTKRVSCLGVFREKSVEGLEGAAQRFYYRVMRWTSFVVYPLTLSNAVAMLLLMPLTVSLNVSVYCRFCFSSVCGPQRSMYVVVHRLLFVAYVLEESLVLVHSLLTEASVLEWFLCLF